MLKLIFGRSGYGKTEYILNHMCDLATNSNEELVLIVPEQNSFATEKKIIEKIGPILSQRISILSFTRMADAVFRQSGGFPLNPVKEGMKSIFMSLALRECSDNLSLYRSQIGRADFIPVILNTVNEMKSCALSSDDVSSFSVKVNNETLKQKLSDISLISSTYNALLNNAYSDPLDNLSLVYNKLLENNIFEGKVIALDGFSGFTRQELQIIDLLTISAKDLFVTLCGTKEDFEKNNDVFAITNETRKSLVQIAKKNQVNIMTPLELSENFRFKNKNLSSLEKNIYLSKQIKDENEGSGVTIYEGNTIYDECNFVAAEIRRLTTEENYRYSDIVVIARDLTCYKGILNRAFDKNEISYFMEDPQPLTQKTLVVYILSVLEVICSSFSSESIFKMLKTGFTSLDDEDICQLEDYTYVWNINGSKWFSPFTQNPSGFKEGFSESERNLLGRIEKSRQIVIEPLLKFRENTKDKTGGEITKQLFYFLGDKTVIKRLKEKKEEYNIKNDTTSASELDRIWDMVIESLDQLYFSLEDVKLTVKEYTELIKLYMSTEDISFIPQSIDEVTVGTADRIRTASPKIVFALGCMQDQFPRIPSSAGIFTDNERCVLREKGLALSESISQLSAHELFFAYTTVSAPREKLYASWYSQSLSGEEYNPSSIIREIVKILTPSVKMVLDKKDGAFVYCEQDAFELLAGNFTSDNALITDLKDFFSNSARGSVVKKIDSVLKKEPLKIGSAEIAKNLFGGTNINLSASQIEKFYLCPYQYFCTYGLNVKERKRAEINAAEFGTLVHYVLETLFSQYTVSEISAIIDNDELRPKVHSILSDYLKNYLGGEDSKTSRFMYGISRIEKGAVILVRHIISELMSCGFDPLCCELKIDYENNDGDIDPMSITLDDGTKINVRGKIDRVDKLENDGNFYIRIVDYKSGKKEFKINDINFGLNLQMLLYLKAITENGEKKFDRSVSPAAVLYTPVAPNLVSHIQGEDEIEKAFAMEGILIDDNGLMSEIMNKHGKYIRSKSVMNSKELKITFDKIDTLIIHMVKSLMNGNVNARPVKAYDNDACKYCPYCESCGYEIGMDSVDLKDKSKSPVYNEDMEVTK